jgi:hypothetical protein
LAKSRAADPIELKGYHQSAGIFFTLSRSIC